MVYDPVKAHEYYERTKHLKNKSNGHKPDAPKSLPRKASGLRLVRPALGKEANAAAARVSRLKSKVSKLQRALSEVQAALSDKQKASSASNSVSDMGIEELESRHIKIKSTLQEAQRQLSNASQQLGQLAHSELTSEPMFNEHFAQFRSAEGIPSK